MRYFAILKYKRVLKQREQFDRFHECFALWFRQTGCVLRHFLEFDFIGKDDEIIVRVIIRSFLPTEMHQHIVPLIKIDKAFAFVGMDLDENSLPTMARRKYVQRTILPRRIIFPALNSRRFRLRAWLGAPPNNDMSFSKSFQIQVE